MCASKHKLDNLTVIIDYNKIQSSGFVDDIQPLEPLLDKWDAFGFSCYQCDGHDPSALISELQWKADSRPNCLIAHTIKGKGIPFAENDPMWHHKSNITEEQFKAMEEAL